jgi:hypothetical protein
MTQDAARQCNRAIRVNRRAAALRHVEVLQAENSDVEHCSQLDEIKWVLNQL